MKSSWLSESVLNLYFFHRNEPIFFCAKNLFYCYTAKTYLQQRMFGMCAQDTLCQHRVYCDSSSPQNVCYGSCNTHSIYLLSIHILLILLFQKMSTNYTIMRCCNLLSVLQNDWNLSCKHLYHPCAK